MARMAKQMHLLSREVRNVEIFVGCSAAGNHLLGPISCFRDAAAQRPIAESHVRLGKRHHWNAEKSELKFLLSNSHGYLMAPKRIRNVDSINTQRRCAP